MKNFIYILFLFVSLFAGNELFSQKNRERVEELRASFISKKLELTEAEAEKFWPVYNEYTDKMRFVKRNLHQRYKSRVEPLSEKDAEELYQLELQSRQAETDIHKQYSDRIKAIIGVKKVIRLRQAEEEFKREIIENIKGKRE